MVVNQIEDDVFLLIGETYQSNSTAFVSQDHVLLVDAMGSGHDADALRNFVETELQKQVRFIVCTHFFSDHLAAFKLFPRASVIAHKNYSTPSLLNFIDRKQRRRTSANPTFGFG